MNFLGWAVLLYEVLTSLGYASPFGSDELRNRVGYAFFVVVNGPLAAAVIMNSNALVLHDVAKTSGVFIHLNPALVAYGEFEGGGGLDDDDNYWVEGSVR